MVSDLPQLLGDAGAMVMAHTAFIAICGAIVFSGVAKGIERWAKILMPGLFCILGVLFLVSIQLDGFSKALDFLFAPDFSKITWAAILEAVGHSFFTLSLGMGAMITYGSYLPKNSRLPRVAFTIIFLDTAIALTAGLIMFSIVFSHGGSVAAGPGLMFSTMPKLFASMQGSYFLFVGFFSLVAFAAITSGMSLLEVSVSYLVDRFRIARHKATVLVAGSVWVVGLLCALSFNLLKGFPVDFFNLLDKTTSNILMPAGGIVVTLFFGFKVQPDEISKVMGLRGPLLHVFLWTVRLVAPVAISVVMGMGILDW